MKRIGIDARLYFQTGVGTYIRNLLFELEKIAPEDLEFYIYLKAGDIDQVHFSKPNFIKRLANYHWHSLGEQIGFLKLLLGDQLDLMHFTYFSYPVLYSKKFIVTVHDLTPLFFKTGRASTKNPLVYNVKYWFYKLVMAIQVKKSTQIICPTRTIKKHLTKIYGEKYDNKIVVTYEGINHELIEAEANSQLSNKFSDFFIYVGNFYPHKNIEKLIKVYAHIKTKIKLILIGPNDFFAHKVNRLIQKNHLEKQVIFYHNSRVGDLKWFYKNAKALIHPSLSEGFGLPIVEAFYFNCPIIASDIEVFKELLGKQYLSFHPKNMADMTDAIKYFILKKPVFNNLDLNTRFSFPKMAEETLLTYKNSLT